VLDGDNPVGYPQKPFDNNLIPSPAAASETALFGYNTFAEPSPDEVVLHPRIVSIIFQSSAEKPARFMSKN
jgi:hypothetical protein